MQKYDYAFLDGHPCLVSDSEAWLYADGEWKRIALGSVLLDAPLISKAQFDNMFGTLPHLPAEAFKS